MRLVSIDPELCILCGRCVEACGYDALAMTSTEADDLVAMLHRPGSCTRCRLCSEVCPTGACTVAHRKRSAVSQAPPPEPVRLEAGAAR